MANGADTEDYAHITNIRPGLKRELAFALKSHAEYSDSIGCTRTRKFPIDDLGNNLTKDCNDNKRLKSLGTVNVNGSFEKLINDEDMANCISDEEPKSDLVDSINDAEHKVATVELSYNKNLVEESIELSGLGFNEESNKGEVLPVSKEIESSKRVVIGKSENKKLKRLKLEKVPTRLKELLESGLLEGLTVKYQRGLKTRGALGDGLGGIISGSRILCFCEQCDGIKVVTPNVFEVHAGSSNRRPSDYIYLENGKSLRDVLLACKNVPLECLEVFMQRVVGSSSAEVVGFCGKCKSYITGCGGKEMLLCRSCGLIKESQPSHVSNIDDKVSQLSPASTLDMEDFQPCPVYICDIKETQETSASMLGNKCRPLKTSCSKPSNSNLPCSSQRKGKITRKDVGLHKLVFQNDILTDGTELAYYVRGQKFLQGYKKGLGIFCFCCESEVSPSLFEAHAGFASRRKPYLNIYTSNGVSLHELALRLSNFRKLNEKESDNLCSICSDGGDLLCCDNCPRAFHTDCVSLPCIPTGTWYCKYCQSMIEREKFVETNANAIAAGRIAGTDPLEEITKRCIRILGTLEADVGGCALCRGHEFSNSGFGPQTVIICDQCEKEYHVGCLKEHELEDLQEIPVGKWFCCKDCNRIHSALEELVASGDKPLPESLMGILMTKRGNEGGADLDIKWRLLNGRMAIEDTEDFDMLSKALAIFHDRFDPVADFNSGVRDLIPHMVFGRKVRYQDFGGMHCAVLKVNSSVVSAGIIRIFGEGVAELPLVATSTESQGQGYFQVLFSCIENLLVSLNVKKFVLPAADEAESLWTDKFGFTKIAKEELMNHQKDHQMMIFQGTAMLQKLVVSS